MIADALNSKELDWKEFDLKRGDYLSRAGEIERYFYFIQEGAFRAYTIIEDQEFTLRFAYKGSIFTSLSSFYSGKKGDMFLQAIRASKVLRCRKTEFEAYITASEERLIEYKALLEQLVIDCLERENDLLIQDPKSRLKRVLERSPQLFQEVPHKYIAAYLRMSPETLSRLMNS